MVKLDTLLYWMDLIMNCFSLGTLVFTLILLAITVYSTRECCLKSVDNYSNKERMKYYSLIGYCGKEDSLFIFTMTAIFSVVVSLVGISNMFTSRQDTCVWFTMAIIAILIGITIYLVRKLYHYRIMKALHLLYEEEEREQRNANE